MKIIIASCAVSLIFSQCVGIVIGEGWYQIHPRVSSTEAFRSHPTPRKGATMVNIAGKVYMFGGLIKVPDCDTRRDIMLQGRCNVTGHYEYSNELWRFDPVYLTWELLKLSSDIQPEGRELHSASVLPDNRMLIFGGRAKTKKAETHDYFSDLWMLDSGRITNHKVSNSEYNVTIPEVTFLESHIHVDIERNTHVGTGDLCVEDIKIGVNIVHPCTRQLYLVLHGPMKDKVEVKS